jgi:hypothetical protein
MAGQSSERAARTPGRWMAGEGLNGGAASPADFLVHHQLAFAA